MIKTSKHTIKFANQGKLSAYHLFLKEYRRVAQLYLDYLWDHPHTFNNQVLDISSQLYNVPLFISTKQIPITTTLSARALKCCSTQVCGVIKAVLEKPRRRLYKLQQLQSENKDTTKLLNRINKHPITKPNITNINPELNSICCDIQESNHYNTFLQLKSIGKAFKKIRIPIKYHRHSNKLKAKGKMLNSILFTDDHIQLRWDIPKPKKRVKGITLGADQGFKTTLTFSNGIITQHQDIHGHSLESICKKLSRKAKGSKSFLKTQQHRTNFINWSINQLNFTGIKSINLENIININYRRNTSRLLKHWTNTLIRDKLLDVSETEGFQINLQSSTYRSQRCSQCGMVRKSNRKGKVYSCNSCGLVIDADLNAAKNHAITLPDVSGLRKLELNHKGFYWIINGLFTLTGEALTAPLSK